MLLGWSTDVNDVGNFEKLIPHLKHSTQIIKSHGTTEISRHLFLIKKTIRYCYSAIVIYKIEIKIIENYG
jgi:hypothetical protein